MNGACERCTRSEILCECDDEMTFTDDDLKRLKDDCGRDFTGIYPHQQKAILALIARLEAAEVIAKVDARHAPNDPDVLVWRKAAGK